MKTKQTTLEKLLNGAKTRCCVFFVSGEKYTGLRVSKQSKAAGIVEIEISRVTGTVGALEAETVILRAGTPCEINT